MTFRPEKTGLCFAFEIQGTGFIYGEIIELNNSVNAINIYPNPTQNVLTTSGLRNPAVANILSAIGTRLQTNTLNSDVNTINVQDQPAGIYFPELQAVTARTVKRFVKQ